MKPKPIKELLIILRDNMPLLQTGMCELNRQLRYFGEITSEECDLIDEYIYHHVPKDAKLLWWWNIGEAEPRINWLNEQINSL